VILLFGGNCQLGQELTALAKKCAIPLRSLSRSEAHISNPTAVRQTIEALRPTLVVNAAAYTNVDMAEQEVELVEQSNVIGPSVLAEVCSLREIALIHLSTDYVFDGMQTGPYREDDAVKPINAYGASKAAGELAVRDRLVNHIILRTSWLYGIYGHNILKTILKLASEREKLRFAFDQRGCPTSTSDLAEAILRVAQRLATGQQQRGTYHVAGTGATTWYDFACHVVAKQGSLTERYPEVCPIAARDYPSSARRPNNSVLECTLFESTFGFRCQP
jgi:dTDP-4-dehydrorhamnose reductase